MTYFLGNAKTEDYKKIVSDLSQNYHKMGVNMSLKIHFCTLSFGFFSKNLGSISDEHGERFHQDLKSYEERYHHFGKKICLLLRDTDPNQ